MKAMLIAEKKSEMDIIKSVYDRYGFKDEIDFYMQAGHILGLKTPKELDAEKYGKWSLKSIPEVYPYEYRINPGKENLFNNIKKGLRSGQYDYIIHAGDPDGEGELLIRETIESIGCKLPVKRFWTNDLTDKGVTKALNNMKDDSEYDGWGNASLVRQRADYQFGMNITAGVTLKLGDLCKLGRVKAAIISILAKRELEIENFVEEKSYKPAFVYKDCEFVLDKPLQTEEDALAYLPKEDAATVSDVSVKKKSQKAPKLFKLSTLQQEVYKQLKWGADKTLAVLQELYLSKATSYPRSACEYISTNEDIGSIAKAVLREQLFSLDTELLARTPDDVLKDKTYCNDKEIASEGHTAIIPTGKGLSSSASKDQQDLYRIICRRFLAMFSAPKETQTTKVSAMFSNSEDIYEYSETVDLTSGYEFILDPCYKMRQGSGVSYSKDMTLTPIEKKAKECVTKPPARYNDGSLIKAMDKPADFEDETGKTKFSIGTEATRASIVKECGENGYFTVDKKGHYFATEKAKTVYTTFKDVPLFNIWESGRWESMFEQIRRREADHHKVEEELINQMISSTNDIKAITPAVRLKSGFSKGDSKALGKCPNCKADVLKGKFGVYCSGKCGMTFKAFGKELTDAQIKSLLAGKKTLVKGFYSKQKKKKYDMNLTPKGTKSFEYNGKTMYGWDFETEPA